MYSCFLILFLLRLLKKDLFREGRRSQFIPSGIVSLHIYWKVEQTYGISKNYWGIKVKTTEIYTHEGNKDMGKIKSPLDNLQMKVGEEV